MQKLLLRAFLTPRHLMQNQIQDHQEQMQLGVKLDTQVCLLQLLPKNKKDKMLITVLPTHCNHRGSFKSKNIQILDRALLIDVI